MRVRYMSVEKKHTYTLKVFSVMKSVGRRLVKPFMSKENSTPMKMYSCVPPTPVQSEYSISRMT